MLEVSLPSFWLFRKTSKRDKVFECREGSGSGLESSGVELCVCRSLVLSSELRLPSHAGGLPQVLKATPDGLLVVVVGLLLSIDYGHPENQGGVDSSRIGT